MFTDDEIRDAFHSAFAAELRDMSVNPAMLSAVRRRHSRQQRMLAVGAPLGVAVLSAGAVIGASTVHSRAENSPLPIGSGGSPTSDPSPSDQTVIPNQSVALLTHTLSLPGDWTLSGNRQLIDLNTIEPAQVVGGKDQSVTATSPDGTQQFSATVYSGPIADAERSGGNAATDDPTFVHVWIAGNEASIKVTGPATRCLTVTPSKHQASNRQLTRLSRHAKPGHATPKAYGFVEGACPPDQSGHAPYGEARYTFGDGDFMMVDTFGMDTDALQSFLTTALG